MLKKRPINLNLFTIRFPLTALVSIAHRISGLFLFFLIPLCLKVLEQSLSSAENFLALKTIFSAAWVKVIIILALTALIYHLIAGVRHLLMEFMGLGKTKASARIGAYLVIIFTLGTVTWLSYYLVGGGL